MELFLTIPNLINFLTDGEVWTQSRKVFFNTDTDMSAVDIFDIYRTRFQIEFLYRDSKQFTGLCNCQSRDVKAMSNHIPCRICVMAMMKV